MLFAGRARGKSDRPLYINVPVSEQGLVEEMEKARTVNSRAHASELLYGDAAYLQGLAQTQLPEFDWQLHHVRSARYVVKGEPKRAKL